MVFILFIYIFYPMQDSQKPPDVHGYGTVISGVDGPSTRKFSFVINPGKIVKRGQFIQLDSEEGKLIGRVSDVYKTNRYFMKPESVKEYESSGKRMNSIFPVSDWEYLVADVQTLGASHSGGFSSSLFPPSPGTKVDDPDSGILSGFFGMDQRGLKLGSMPHHDVEIRISPTRFLQKHLAILAMSGAGKSFLSSVIVEELLDRTPEQGQISTVIIDTHGEYTSFADDPEYSGKTKIFPVSDVKIGLPNLPPGQMREFMPKLSFTQARELSRVMRSMGKKSYDIGDLIKEIEGKEDLKSVTRDVLLSNLEELKRTDIFGNSDSPDMNELARQGGLSVIDLSSTTDLFRKQMIVAHFARRLFDARRKDSIPPFLLVVEEAHQFAPERMKEEHAISKGVITLIAREGRKFNASLCLISQRPIQLSTTALSQCNTHFILRVTNPYDLDHIGKSSEGINQSVLNQISSLPVGSGLIVGEAVNFPLFVKIRGRKSRPSSKGLPMEDAAREYHKKTQQKKKDAREFM
jgi:DNA helicase HerA-like ATPase